MGDRGLSCGHAMMTSSNGNIFRVTGPLCGEFTGPGEFPAQRPVTRSFGVFFDLRLNNWLSKQSLGWWFETPPWSLWRHCNVIICFIVFFKTKPKESGIFYWVHRENMWRRRGPGGTCDIAHKVKKCIVMLPLTQYHELSKGYRQRFTVIHVV